MIDKIAFSAYVNGKHNMTVEQLAEATFRQEEAVRKMQTLLGEEMSKLVGLRKALRERRPKPVLRVVRR